MSKKYLEELNEELEKTEQVTNRWLDRRLIMFGVRWTITIALYVIFWNRWPWLKWTLFLTVPLGAYALYMITSTQDKLADKMAELKQTMKDLESFEEE